MTQNWHQIWNQRSATGAAPYSLRHLMDLDGFDFGAGRVTTEDMREYALEIAKRLAVTDEASVYEVGCGAGAFLYSLCEKFRLRIGGCDYAAPLIAVVSRQFPRGEFIVAEAAAISPEPKYDVVLANGVFHYFPDLNYARRVVERMIEKAISVVAILDIPHASTRNEAEMARRAQLGSELYDEKYSGLEHLYYEPHWFGEIAKKNNCRWENFGQLIPNYLQNPFRFDVVIRKN
jgi:trans-aconitate methyltransferase